MRSKDAKRGRGLRWLLATVLLGLGVLLSACCGTSCRHQGLLAPGPRPNQAPVVASALPSGAELSS